MFKSKEAVCNPNSSAPAIATAIEDDKLIVSVFVLFLIKIFSNLPILPEILWACISPLALILSLIKVVPVPKIPDKPVIVPLELILPKEVIVPTE